MTTHPSKFKNSNLSYCDSTSAVLFCDRDSGGHIKVVATVVVGGVLSAGASTVQHCRLLCWPDFQCETDPSMYPYSIFVKFNIQ